VKRWSSACEKPVKTRFTNEAPRPVTSGSHAEARAAAQSAIPAGAPAPLAMSADDHAPQPSPQRQLPLLGVPGEPCAECGSPLAGDQRYCLACGRRRGPARLDVLRAARQRAASPRTLIHADPPPAAAAAGWWPAGVVSPRIAATLCVAMLVGGIALGAAAGPGAPSSLAAGGRQIIALVQPSAAPPAAAPALPAPPAVPELPATPPVPEAPTATDDTAPADDGAATDTPAEAEIPADDGEDTADAGTGDEGDDTPETAPPSPLPPVKHVWLISLTGQRYAETWGAKATEPYFKELAARGTVLSRVFSVAHGTLPGAIALLSGQGPNPATQAGCATPAPLDPGTVAPVADDPLQQAKGSGCVYSAAVTTLPDQLTGAGLTWKAYVESIASPDPDGQQSCRHPDAGAADPFTAPRPGDAYLTARNPFVYFASIVGDPICGSNVVGLDRLAPDLAAADQTPNFSYVVPDACHDGSPVPCAPGAPAGLAATAAWLKGLVDEIQGTDAYKDGGLILVTTDQAPSDGLLVDSRGCLCTAGTADTPFWPNTPDPGAPAAPAGTPLLPAPGTTGPSPSAVVNRGPRGGGRVGALLLSPFVTAGRTVGQGYDQVSLLKSIEDLFGLEHLGAAADPGHKPLGPGVYAEYTPPADQRDR
jgi:hypothetical protein